MLTEATGDPYQRFVYAKQHLSGFQRPSKEFHQTHFTTEANAMKSLIYTHNYKTCSMCLAYKCPTRTSRAQGITFNLFETVSLISYKHVCFANYRTAFYLMQIRLSEIV